MGDHADGQILLLILLEIKSNFLYGYDGRGRSVFEVGISIAEDPNQALDKKHQTKKLPGKKGWDMIWLSYTTLIQ